MCSFYFILFLFLSLVFLSILAQSRRSPKLPNTPQTQEGPIKKRPQASYVPGLPSLLAQRPRDLAPDLTPNTLAQAASSPSYSPWLQRCSPCPLTTRFTLAYRLHSAHLCRTIPIVTLHTTLPMPHTSHESLPRASQLPLKSRPQLQDTPPTLQEPKKSQVPGFFFFLEKST